MRTCPALATLLLLLLLLLIPGLARAGAANGTGTGGSDLVPPPTWVRTYGTVDNDWIQEIVQIPGRRYLAVGRTDDHFPRAVLWVEELECDGTPVWQKAYMPAQPARGYSIQRTPDGSIVGGALSMFSFEDWWILRLDAAGLPIWQQRVGGPGMDELRRVRLLADGSVLAIGDSSSFGSGPGDLDGWIVRMDAATGAILWQLRFGGPGIDYAFDATQLLGSFTSDIVVVGNRGGFAGDGWAARITLAGTLVWERSFDAGGAESFYDVEPAPGGGCLIGGGTSGKTWLVRLDAAGAIAWERTYSEAGSPAETNTKLSAAPGPTWIVANNEFVSGGPDLDSLVMRVDDSGAILWQRRIGGPSSDRVHSVQWLAPTTGTFVDGGVIAGGEIMGVGLGARDAVAYKLDGVGNSPGCPLVKPVTETVGVVASIVTPLATMTPTAVVAVPTFEAPFDPGLVDIVQCTTGRCR